MARPQKAPPRLAAGILAAIAIATFLVVLTGKPLSCSFVETTSQAAPMTSTSLAPGSVAPSTTASSAPTSPAPIVTGSTTCRPHPALPWVAVGTISAAAVALFGHEMKSATLGPLSFTRFEREFEKVRKDIDEVRDVVLNRISVDTKQQVFVGVDQRAVEEGARHVAQALADVILDNPNVDELSRLIDTLLREPTSELVDKLLLTWVEVQKQIITARGVEMSPEWAVKGDQLASWYWKFEKELGLLADANRQLLRNPWDLEKRTIANLIAVAQMTLDYLDARADEETAQEFRAQSGGAAARPPADPQ